MRKLKVVAVPGNPLVYTVEEARAILKVGRSAMIRLCQSGELRSYRIGRTRRIPAKAIEEFLAGATSGNLT